jgi:glycosyltransferase involved in cell wall biosynthesis
MGAQSLGTSLRICLVAHALRLHDGQGRVNLAVARAILEHGHDLTILAMTCSDDLIDHSKVRFVQTGSDKLPTQLLRNIHFANQSAAWLRRHRSEFDVIQANGFVTWEACDVVAVHFVHSAWQKSPVFPFQRLSLNPGDWYQRLYTAWNARWERSAFRRAKEIVAVSRRTAAEVESLGLTRKPVRVIYNGVDLEEFHPGESRRQSFGLADEYPLLLFVGDIQTPRKNLPTALRALQKLPEVHLVIAAATAGSPYLALADEMGLRDRVHFIGKTPRVAELMRSSDIMIFPSRYEAHPLVVMEALACGLPTVLSAGIAEGESFADACVLIQDATDADAFAGAVRQLILDSLARQKLGKLGQQVTGEMTWEKTGNQYVALYESLVRARRAE